jgi:glycosyltransferase involved in cell wall biosynthesis
MKISVCMASYNGEKYIRQQIDSILPQLGESDELIISDDSSTDDTISVVKSINDNRIKLIKDQKFKSPVSNFENAIKNATGDFIFLCDQDDIWQPNKVESVLPFLKQYDLVVSDCKIVDGDLNIIEDSFFKKMHSSTGFWKNFVKNRYLGCCMAFRKEVLDNALPFPPQIAMHDIWLGLCAELFGHPFFLNEPLVLYRRHGNNASFGSEKSKYTLMFKIKYRISLLKMLIKRKNELKNK